MLYQLSYTPKSIAPKTGRRFLLSKMRRNSLEPEAGSLTVTPCRRKVLQAAARLATSPSIVFTVDPETGLEKI